MFDTKQIQTPPLSLSVIVALVGSLTAGQVFAAPKEVEVINTPDVNVVNTPNVSVTNTPSVEVTNSPTVQLAPNAQIRDRDNPALQPVMFTCRVELLDSDQIGDTLCGEAPSGKTLVIEYIHAQARVPTGQRPYLRVDVSSLDLLRNDLSLEYEFDFEEVRPVLSDTLHTIRQNIRLYHTRFNVVIRFGRTNPWTGVATVDVHFTGYLVD